MRCKPSEDVCLEHCLPLKGMSYCEDGRDRCAHDFGERRETLFAEVQGQRRAFVVRACLECGAWLSLGHSDEAPVHVEVRAAEIAADLDDADRLCDWTLSNESFVSLTAFDERRGWSIAETNMQEHTEAWHAGYLARCIVGHDGGGE